MGRTSQAFKFLGFAITDSFVGTMFELIVEIDLEQAAGTDEVCCLACIVAEVRRTQVELKQKIDNSKVSNQS